MRDQSITRRTALIGTAAEAAVKIAPKAQLKVYPGGPHGLCTTHKDQVNADRLTFLKA
jgi:non-heme chloroperoxidase